MSQLCEKRRGTGRTDVAIVRMRPESNHVDFVVLRKQRRHTNQYQHEGLHERKSSCLHIMM